MAGPESVVLLRNGPVEVADWTGSADLAPLVLLHEGLGSVELWREFPQQLVNATGRRVVAWSRHGHGWSGPTSLPRPTGYMHHEALSVLPDLLTALDITAPILLGHSDGASIALIHAGAGHSVAGVVAMAPHVMVEERSLVGIRAARDRFHSTDLALRMARYHADPDATFRGWNDVWLSAEFRDWNIEEYLPGVVAPVLIIQCADDEYGSLTQVNRIEAQLSGPVEHLLFDTGGHAPHLSHDDAVIRAIADFIHRL